MANREAARDKRNAEDRADLRTGDRTRSKRANARWLGRLGDALQVVRASVAPDITVQRLLILLAVRAHEGMSQKELLGFLDDCSITALSRNLADLSALNSRKQPGPGLVELRTDPMNLRVRRVYLTRKGRALVDDLEGALAGQGAGQASSTGDRRSGDRTRDQSTKARSKT